MAESEIFQDFKSETFRKAEKEPVTLRIGSLFTCYRVEHYGKYFIFKTTTSNSEYCRQLLRREFELSKSLDTPYIAHTILFGTLLPGKEGILMEYVDGRTLDEFLTENPSPAVKRRIFSQLLEVVGYLHSKGIIHNDLKPSNIMIGRTSDTLRLLDFGLSDDDAHFLQRTPGFSAGYAAPELSSHRKADVRSDIYSIGRLMRLLFGKRYGRIAGKCLKLQSSRRYRDIPTLSRAWSHRNRGLKIVAAAGVVAITTVFAFFLALEWKANTATTSRLEEEVASQKEENSRQRESYMMLQAAYENMRDSLNQADESRRIHQEYVNQHIEEFRNGLETRLERVYEKMKNAPTPEDAMQLRLLYLEEVKGYYNKFDRFVGNEDIRPTLNAVFMDFLQQSDNRLNSILLSPTY